MNDKTFTRLLEVIEANPDVTSHKLAYLLLPVVAGERAVLIGAMNVIRALVADDGSDPDYPGALDEWTEAMAFNRHRVAARQLLEKCDWMDAS